MDHEISSKENQRTEQAYIFKQTRKKNTLS